MISVEEQFAIEARAKELVNISLQSADQNQSVALRSMMTRLQGLKGEDSTREIDDAIQSILRDKHGMYSSALDAACFNVAVLETKASKTEGGVTE